MVFRTEFGIQEAFNESKLCYFIIVNWSCLSCFNIISKLLISRCWHCHLATISSFGTYVYVCSCIFFSATIAETRYALYTSIFLQAHKLLEKETISRVWQRPVVPGAFGSQQRFRRQLLSTLCKCRFWTLLKRANAAWVICEIPTEWVQRGGGDAQQENLCELCGNLGEVDRNGYYSLDMYMLSKLCGKRARMQAFCMIYFWNCVSDLLRNSPHSWL